jgi:hypothetical protein
MSTQYFYTVFIEDSSTHYKGLIANTVLNIKITQASFGHAKFLLSTDACFASASEQRVAR